MSGFVGIVNLDGAPVDRKLLERLTRFMSYRGPDAQDWWTNSSAGLGHSMLRTTRESISECQPCSLRGQVWITADARIDAREELIGQLRSKGCDVQNVATDVELILHTYDVWREDCVDHLLGDFAFAIWDGPRRKLFCARDRFGIKLFYYSRVGHCLIVSNTLNCIREHPAVSRRLNEQAIGDFLLCGANLELTTTTFADIYRLPAAHVLSCSQGAIGVNRYWQLRADNEIRYPRTSDYVEHFKELLTAAVADRMRATRVAVLMTGGLDSTTVAATARALVPRADNTVALHAYTIVYDHLIPDQERHYSNLVADALSIPLSYLVADDYLLYRNWERAELRQPEPSDEPLLAILQDHLRQVASDNRVALTGWDGDALLREVPHYYFKVLWDTRQFHQLALDALRYLMSQGHLPYIGVRTSLKRMLRLSVPSEGAPEFPGWLNADFIARANLRERWENINAELVPRHPRRPTAFMTYSSRNWAGLFESYDPGVTGLSLEVRHPLFDLRLMDYLLALPPVPWCMDKQLIRIASRGLLPEAVRLRSKTPLAGHVEVELLQRPESEWVDRFEPSVELANYVEREMIPRLARESDPYEVASNTRPLSLNYWLQQLG
jgi:asparagine synthase (glutamine-hydrolysing)